MSQLFLFMSQLNQVRIMLAGSIQDCGKEMCQVINGTCKRWLEADLVAHGSTSTMQKKFIDYARQLSILYAI